MWSVHILNETVEYALYSLPEEMQARFLRIVELIEHYGLTRVGMPHVRHVQGKIWEVRLSAKDQIGRGLYVTTSGQRVVVLRFFIKKTQKTPKNEISIAFERLENLSNESR
jgi:phage-related protein